MRVSFLLPCIVLSMFIVVSGCDENTEPTSKPASSRTESRQETAKGRIVDTQTKPIPKDLWEAIQPAIVECSIMGDGAFFRTIMYLQSGYLHDRKWDYQSTTTTSEDFAAKSEANVLIEGNCTSKIRLSDGGMIHIKGDLIGELDIKGQCEIIIAGKISKDASIKTDGIVRVLVGADVNGKLVNMGSSVYFIRGNLNGHVVTGDSSTYIHVSGDCHASFADSGDDGSMLRLIVEGYMPLSNIEQLRKLKYTQVTAFIEESDSPRSIRPTSGHHGQIWYVKNLKTP